MGESGVPLSPKRKKASWSALPRDDRWWRCKNGLRCEDSSKRLGLLDVICSKTISSGSLLMNNSWAFGCHSKTKFVRTWWHVRRTYLVCSARATMTLTRSATVAWLLAMGPCSASPSGNVQRERFPPPAIPEVLEGYTWEPSGGLAWSADTE